MILRVTSKYKCIIFHNKSLQRYLLSKYLDVRQKESGTELKPMSLMVFLCELSGMLRLELSGAHLDELLCLGQAALGDGNIHAGCFDSVTIKNRAVDLFLILVGWFSFH